MHDEGAEMKSHRNLLSIVGGLLIMLLFTAPACALTCKASGSVSEYVALDSVLKASVGDFGINKKIWVSPPITATFACTDTDNYAQGESAFLWLDPKNSLSALHESLEIGITYRNVDYKLVNGAKIEIGPATICRPDGKGGCLKTAQSQTFSLTYQVYIKTTGLKPASDGKVLGNINLALFQVDGVGGLRGGSGGNDGNFNLYLSGLDRLTFLACTPKVWLTPDVLDFGVINGRWAQPGHIEKIKPFVVNVELVPEAGGKSCEGETLQMTISSANYVKDGQIIMPDAGSGFGFILSPASTMVPRIDLNMPETFGIISNEFIERPFYAAFIWTGSNPRLGAYEATATVTVTFR